MIKRYNVYLPAETRVIMNIDFCLLEATTHTLLKKRVFMEFGMWVQIPYNYYKKNLLIN